MGGIVENVIIATVFLIVCGGILALLLVLAEKFILNFGPCAIDINDGERKLTVNGGGSLLSLLSSQNIFIPSACGGRGSCAYCKVTVASGGGQITPVEDPYLTVEERNSLVRLSCQVKVRSDVAIRVPRELFSVKRFRTRLTEKTALTYDTVGLRLELLDPQEIEFVAGQYAQLESREYKGREAVIRAYSISSPPKDRHHLEFIIRKVPDGICSTWVFDHLKIGQEVQLSGPYGDFRLTQNDAPIIFVAGGSGMAPIWSILRDMQQCRNTRTARYYYTARTQDDLYFVNELRALEKELPSFTFIPALTREPEGSNWTGERNRLTKIIPRDIPDASRHEAYLCGSPGLINACIEELKKCGMPDTHIFFDKFD